MGNKLREVFNTAPPTKDELEWLQRCYEEDRKDKKCVACSHYNYNLEVSGKTYYQGDCDLGHVAWFGRKNHCADWEGEI